jgi:hypothetical protein
MNAYKGIRNGRLSIASAVTAAVVVILMAGCATGGLWGPDYEAILKSSPPYGTERHLDELEFRYQDAHQPELAALRDAFDLENVAGTGSDRERIIRLMEWVFEKVPHDGRSSPAAWNTFDIVRYHEATGHGVNCRKLAIMLSEVYLAVGYPARHVTCKPRPAQFSDCHVVTAVWSPEDRRWLMMDPSFRAYVTDEAETILGVREFRKALRTGASISLNSNASLHGMPYPEGAYFRYMTKNLYRYDVPLEARMGYEAPSNDTAFVEVTPMEHSRPGIYTGGWADGSTWMHAITHNPAELWKAP